MHRVIIVEDSDWIRKGLEFTVPWADYGYTVVGTASNGLEGLELIASAKPDLAIVDIKMPQLDGLSMIERAREGGGGAPEFIVISGYNEFELTRRAILLGARDYLLKPIADEELAAALRRLSAVLGGAKATSRLEAILDRQSFDPAFVAFFNGLLEESLRRDDLAAYAIRRAEERYATDLSLGTVAEEVRVSESTLGKRFKKATGSTFVEYLTMVRIKKALEFLADPGCRVGEVASLVGIGDARYFSGLFKRYTGFTPSQFRKLVEGGDFPVDAGPRPT